MGNQLAAAQTTGSYQDQQVLQQRIGEFQLVDQLGGGRFLKSFMCLHDEGQVRLPPSLRQQHVVGLLLSGSSTQRGLGCSS